MTINWRASLVPAAAVIPAPIGYIKVVAVKKLVVVLLVGWCSCCCLMKIECDIEPPAILWKQDVTSARKCVCSSPLSHWEQIGVLKAGFTALNILAWNDKVWLLVHFVGSEREVMINRNSRGGTRTGKSEVKFLDFSTTNDCESIYQGCFHWSRTKVRGSKMIRYHRSSHSKRCRLGIGNFSLIKEGSQHRMWKQSLWVPGGVWSQGWNLKELTEGHTRVGACGLIWPNTGKLTRSRHEKDWQFESTFLISWVVVHGRS